MTEETKVPRLQEQMDRVEKIVHHTPFRMFVAGVVGGSFWSFKFFWAARVSGGWRDIR